MKSLSLGGKVGLGLLTFVIVLYVINFISFPIAFQDNGGTTWADYAAVLSESALVILGFPLRGIAQSVCPSEIHIATGAGTIEIQPYPSAVITVVAACLNCFLLGYCLQGLRAGWRKLMTP